MNVKDEVCNAFNAHATEYEQAAKIQYEIGERVFERLTYLKIEPRYILDLGCGPGQFSQRLKKYYPKACIVGLDLAPAMLNLARAKQNWRRTWALVNGDMTTLPFATGTFDLVFANQVIHWTSPLSDLFAELNRVMNAQGCFMFSTLGPDTFKELRQAFAKGDTHVHTNDFTDMHIVGDCLLSEYFTDPVMDMEILTAHYASLKHLLHGLKSQGVRNMHSERNPGLTGKQTWSIFERSMEACRTPDGKYPLTYEVVYGHAWKSERRRVAQGVETIISVAQLGKRTQDHGNGY
jgi:malonyl-CoA O-methyltransferase